MDVFRILGGNEAVKAAQLGDKDSLKAAVEKQLEEQMSPRSKNKQTQTLIEKLQSVTQKVKKQKKEGDTSAIPSARARLAVSLQALDSQHREEEALDDDAAQADVPEELHLATQRIQEIVRYRDSLDNEHNTKDKQEEEEGGNKDKEEDSCDGEKRPAEELAEKMRLINDLMELLKDE